MLLEICMQFNIVIYSIIAGFITGILFDIYRIIRGLNKIKIIDIVGDLLFWALSGLIIFTFLLYMNYAFLTPYVYIFIIISLLLYFRLISKYFYSLEVIILTFLSGIIRVILKNLIYPLKLFIYKITDKNKS